MRTWTRKPWPRRFGAARTRRTSPNKAAPNGEPAFNLASAQREWKAQLNLNRTMNGAQQVRLDESIRSGLAMYDRIDALADEWDGKGWGPLSRANLEAARQDRAAHLGCRDDRAGRIDAHGGSAARRRIESPGLVGQGHDRGDDRARPREHADSAHGAADAGADGAGECAEHRARATGDARARQRRPEVG